METILQRRHVLCALLAVLIPGTMHAQSYPDKPITIVVPWPAGASSDAMARLVARHLQQRVQQPVIVDNRAGASGNVGTQYVAGRPGDGYTLLQTSGPFSINPGLYTKLPFDTERDFVAIAHLTTSPSVVVVHESVPAKSIEDLVAMAKDPSKPLNYASPGNGTAQHLGMELLKAKAGLSLSHIAYKGGAPAITDLVGGHVRIGMLGYPDAAPHLKAGRLRALAVTTDKRFPLLKDVPTLIEKGLADGSSGGWTGIHAPSATPAPIVSQLNQHINAILAEPEVRSLITDLGFEAQNASPQQFDAFVRQQIKDWGRAVTLSGAKVD